MIYSNSRYYNGSLHQVSGTVSVQRKFPFGDFKSFSYIWTDTDRPDILASRFFNDPQSWWIIADVNPEIMDWSKVSSGTAIRIPYA